MNNILTLPSVNLEIYFDTQRSSYKGYAKIPIVDYAVSIGGSSLNIAMAIKAGGLDPTLFAFVSKDNPDGLIDTLLFHLNKLRVTNKLFPILKQDSIALIDRATGHPDIIKGYRSPFCEGNQLFTEIRQAKDQYDFKIFLVLLSEILIWSMFCLLAIVRMCWFPEKIFWLNMVYT